MSDTKFTPEKGWDYDPVDRVIVEDGIRDIAHMDNTAREIDAYMLAAAPDLYEALIEAMQWNGLEEEVPPMQYVIDQCNAALAKARGEQ